MPIEHFVITIQSVWDKEPNAIATESGLIETAGLTAEEVYEEVVQQGVDHWQEAYGTGRGIQSSSLGNVAVLFYHREVNEPAN